MADKDPLIGIRRVIRSFGTMPDEYSFTGEDIERVTGGYVNSGVLRMWVSEGG